MIGERRGFECPRESRWSQQHLFCTTKGMNTNESMPDRPNVTRRPGKWYRMVGQRCGFESPCLPHTFSFFWHYSEPGFRVRLQVFFLKMFLWPCPIRLPIFSLCNNFLQKILRFLWGPVTASSASEAEVKTQTHVSRRSPVETGMFRNQNFR